MAAPVPATDYATMLRYVFGNVNSLNESLVILRNRLATWRTTFFPLLDKNNPQEAKIHSWIIPSIIMGDEMADTLTFYEVSALAELIVNQVAALAFNGYVNPSIEVACVAAFNTAWT